LNNTKKIFFEYSKMADQYYGNMMEAYSKREYRKASELLWGVITQSIKALASLYQVFWTNHRDFFNFTRQIAKESNDPEYHKLFLDLNVLHKNFYDKEIEEIDFPIYLEKAELFIEKTKGLINKRLKELEEI